MMLQRSLGFARIFSMNGSNMLGSTSGSLSNVSLGRADKPALFASKRSQKPGSAMHAAKRCSPLAARGQVAAEAPTQEHHLLGVDFGPRQCELDDRPNHILPVGAEHEPL